jgi:hypothetical protein
MRGKSNVSCGGIVHAADRLVAPAFPARLSNTDHGAGQARIESFAKARIGVSRGLGTRWRPFAPNRNSAIGGGNQHFPPRPTPAKSLVSKDGRVAEWFKAPVLKYAGARTGRYHQVMLCRFFSPSRPMPRLSSPSRYL